MLLINCEPEVVLPACDYGREVVNILGHCEDDISPVFPYLNAIIPGAQYNTDAQILRIRWDGHVVTLQPHEIAINTFDDADAAIQGLARLQELINNTWERRDEIEPSTEERKRLTPVEIYQLLPKTNCKACGEPTCFVFAAKLVAGDVAIEACEPLFTDAYATQREKLLDKLAHAANV